MIQVMFFLRFRTQLRRIRTEMIASLEKAIAGVLEAAGGKVLQERQLFSAVFDETSLGFWLDMLFVIKSITEELKGVSSELEGYSCVFARDVPDYDMERLCRTLAYEDGETGIWCSPELRKFLAPYVDFSPPLSPHREGRLLDRSLTGDYVRIRNIKSFVQPSTAGDAGTEVFPDRHLPRTKIEQALSRGARQNTVLLGPEFIGKRDGLYHYCAGLLKDVPPLVIRFGSGGEGLCCFGDALTPRARSFIAGYIQPADLEELDVLRNLIFQDRLRNELSGYIIRKGGDFLQLLVKNYMIAARAKGRPPVLILENIHGADDVVLRIFIDSYTVLQPEIKEMLIYGTCTGEERLKPWRKIFPRTIKFSSADFPPLVFPEMPPDLWEFCYAVHLLGMFFPGDLIPRLLEEEGKNPLMLSLVFDILSRLGVFDYAEDPVPRGRDFLLRAEAVLGGRKDGIQALVRRRLLSWVNTGRLRPCFNLLRILVKLGEEGGDELILKTICGDVTNGTYKDIDRTIAEGNFDYVIGAARSPVLLYIFKTLKALNYGNEAEINAAFQVPVPKETAFPYNLQILLNLTGYYLGINDIKLALETVKGAMLLSQEKRENSSRVYRLFSLVNQVKRQTGEAMEYISFSIENVEKTEQADELAVTAYYAAGIQYLYGNISNAQRLARQAEEAAAACGQGRWADRALFLRGKLFFETGRYQDALDIFRFLERYPSGVSSGEKEHVLSAWIFRTSLYLGQAGAAPPAALAGGDFSLFEIEAAYFAGDYQRTLDLAGGLSPGLSETDFLYTEQPDWRSGFAQCETLVVPLGELRRHIISTYRSLALGQMGAASPEGGKGAVQYMRRLTRNEILPDMDPQEVFYFYALYRVLQDAEADQIDMNTAVSMAFKRLQRRASRIDDPETKRDFLNLNHWNKALGLVAREYKLI